jgi:2-amino-4-hydroxy-6-hydroxymethyldihydropteridine diphosphokinase
VKVTKVIGPRRLVLALSWRTIWPQSRIEYAIPSFPLASEAALPAGNFFLETSDHKPETWPVHKLVYLSLGSNLGDRAANLNSAISRLSGLGEVVAVSSFYETEPVEVTGQPWFLNCAVALDTQKMPKQLLSGILDVEQQMGRRRLEKKGPRNIDIDILLFGNSIVDTKYLNIPHLAMHQRRFVLEPLAEIAPEVRHPAFKRTVRELRDALPPGKQAVRKVGKS